MNKLEETTVISLVQDIADFTSQISFALVMDATGDNYDSTDDQILEVTDQIRKRAGEITDAIQNVFGSSSDKLVRLSAESACDSIWDSAGIAISFLEMEISAEEEDE